MNSRQRAPERRQRVNVLIESMIVGNRTMIIVSVSLTRVNGLSQIVYLQQDPGRALFDDHHDYGDERQQEGEDHQTALSIVRIDVREIRTSLTVVFICNARIKAREPRIFGVKTNDFASETIFFVSVRCE